MTYKVIKDLVADAEIDDFGRYAADYSESFARKQFARLNRFLTAEIAESPKTWSCFYITGAPLSRLPVSRRSANELLDRLYCRRRHEDHQRATLLEREKRASGF